MKGIKMANQEILIETLKKLADSREKKEVYTLPERPRSMATGLTIKT